MKKQEAAMIIAGSDSIGGAGVQRDIKTFNGIGALATTVITCITAQNTSGVRAIQDVSVDLIRQQIEAITDEYNITVVKTGMLHKIEIIEVVYDFIFKNPQIKFILDPVMVATSGSKLLDDSAINILKKLISMSYVVTPNIPEAEILSEMKIKTEDDIHLVCKKIYNLGAKNIIIKGGHFDLENEIIINTLFDSKKFYKFTNKRIKNREFHGTGCMFASALSAYIFKNNDLKSSMQAALDFTRIKINDWSEGKLS